MSDIVDVLRKTRKGAMFIIEAPSGTGKSTIVKELLKQDSNLKFSVSDPKICEYFGSGISNLKILKKIFVLDFGLESYKYYKVEYQI